MFNGWHLCYVYDQVQGQICVVIHVCCTAQCAVLLCSATVIQLSVQYYWRLHMLGWHSSICHGIPNINVALLQSVFTCWHAV
jgi:hypothetical protein